MKKIIAFGIILGLLLCSGLSIYSQNTMNSNEREVITKPLQKNVEVILADVSAKTKERLDCTLYQEFLKDGSRTDYQHRIYFTTNDHLKKEIWTHEIGGGYASREFTVSNSKEETAVAYTSLNKIIFICPVRMGVESFNRLQGCSDDVESIDVILQFGREAFSDTRLASGYNINIKKLYFDQIWYLDIVGDEGKTYRFKRLEKNKWVHIETVSAPKQPEDIHAKDNYGRTPLFKAASEGSVQRVEELLKKGVKVDAKDDHGTTPLMFAVGGEKANIECIKTLLDNGANVNVTDNQGWTPLMHATQGGNMEVVKLLIARGADVNAKANGSSVLWRATKRKDQAMIDLLKKAGAKE